jgi:hypothetical protein
MPINWHLLSSLPILFSLAATACPVHNSLPPIFRTQMGDLAVPPCNGGESSLDAFLSLESVPLATGTEQKIGSERRNTNPQTERQKKHTTRFHTRRTTN